MKRILIILFVFFFVKCSKTKIELYNSEKNFCIKLKKVDSLVFYSKGQYQLSEIRNIILFRGNYLITDNSNKSIFVFSKSERKFIKKIGSYGEGPGEYKTIPFLIRGKNSNELHVLDYKLRRISKYDSNLNYISSSNIDPKVFMNKPNSSVRFNENYILKGCFAKKGFKINSEPSLVALNNKLRLFDNFLEWNQLYKDNNAYAIFNPFVFFDTDSELLYAAQGSEINKIYAIDKEFKIIKTFGTNSKYFRKPPDIKLEKLMSSMDATNKFVSQTSRLTNLKVDGVNKLIFVSFTNYNEKVAKSRFFLDGESFLQIYDHDFDCVFDGKIEGNLLNVIQGEIYIYSYNKQEKAVINIYDIIKM